MDAELKYLVNLFDDNDKVVSDAVNKRIIDKGPECLGSLKYIIRQESDENRRNNFKIRYEFFRIVFKLGNLECFWKESEDNHKDLFEMFLLISDVLNPNFSERKFIYNWETMMSNIILDGIVKERDPYKKVNLLNKWFFFYHKFKVVDYTMSDEKSGLLDFVLSRKQGNLISVSILYVIIANELGIDFKIKNFQGGFIPVYVENGKVLFYVNISDEGEIIYKENIDTIPNTPLIVDDNHPYCELTSLYTIFLESLYYVYIDSEEFGKKETIINRLLDIFGPERYISFDPNQNFDDEDFEDFEDFEDDEFDDD